MNKYSLIIAMSFLYPMTSLAECNPIATLCKNTTLGLLNQVEMVNSGDESSHLLLNGKEIYKAKTSYMVVSNDEGIFKNKKYLITKATISYVSKDPCFPEKPASRCGINMVLDLTSGKPVISNAFFSENGESQITWVSWGKANSIIVIDDELRFKYANGHVERITKDKNSSTGSDGGK
ncbi:hypothetical protein [Buttiauxella agrestis]|uniref:hypothetical protein n=1 Tax=Buttiauxella agrestis TaxID=82977 RepID=UPI0015611B1B|nr:hypothetical protein [Buttiauxella agrestis]BCG10459.1 hypothetical protein BADSM9389_31410 [Buttiauxella agrestis]